MAGRTKTTWEKGSSWQSGETKVIRVPVAIADEVLAYARSLDQRDFTNHQHLVLTAIDRYIEDKRQNYHPNQYSKKLDITTRPWDELRKFTEKVKNQPEKLF